METIEDVGFLLDSKETTLQNTIPIIHSDAFLAQLPKKRKKKRRYLDEIIKTQMCKIDKMVTDKKRYELKLFQFNK